MRRVVLLVLGAYVLVAAGNRVAEHFGARRCGCAEDCWCKRPGLKPVPVGVPLGPPRCSLRR